MTRSLSGFTMDLTVWTWPEKNVTSLLVNARSCWARVTPIREPSRRTPTTPLPLTTGLAVIRYCMPWSDTRPPFGLPASAGRASPRRARGSSAWVPTEATTRPCASRISNTSLVMIELKLRATAATRACARRSRCRRLSSKTERKCGSRAITRPWIESWRDSEPSMFSSTAEERSRLSRIPCCTCREMLRFTIHRAPVTSVTTGSTVKSRIFPRRAKRTRIRVPHGARVAGAPVVRVGGMGLRASSSESIKRRRPGDRGRCVPPRGCRLRRDPA